MSGDTDPPYAPEREHFGGYTHQQIWDLVHDALDPLALGRTATAWHSCADTVGDAFAAFTHSTRRSLSRASGQTAEAAWRATLDVAHLGDRTHEVCREVAERMDSNIEAAQTLRGAIPEPLEYCPLDDAAAEAVHGGKRRMEHDTAAAESTAAVQNTMTSVYTPTIPASGDRVPRFAAPRIDPSHDGGPRQ